MLLLHDIPTERAAKPILPDRIRIAIEQFRNTFRENVKLIVNQYNVVINVRIPMNPDTDERGDWFDWPPDAIDNWNRYNVRTNVLPFDWNWVVGIEYVTT